MQFREEISSLPKVTINRSLGSQNSNSCSLRSEIRTYTFQGGVLLNTLVRLAGKLCALLSVPALNLFSAVKSVSEKNEYSFEALSTILLVSTSLCPATASLPLFLFVSPLLLNTKNSINTT
jgi:hypothetical protein